MRRHVQSNWSVVANNAIYRVTQYERNALSADQRWIAESNYMTRNLSYEGTLRLAECQRGLQKLNHRVIDGCIYIKCRDSYYHVNKKVVSDYSIEKI